MNTRLLLLLAAGLLAGPVMSAKAQPYVEDVDNLVDTFMTQRPVVYDNDSWMPRLYTRFENPWLQRSRSDNVVIATVLDGNDIQNDIETVIQTIDTNETNFDLRPGLRVVVGMDVSQQGTIEASYYGLNEWTEHRAVNIDAGEAVRSPFLQFGLIDISGGSGLGQEYTFNSMLHNTELIYRHRMGYHPTRSVELLGGLRWINFFDRFRGAQIFADAAPLAMGGSEDILSQTKNNLVGPEIGLYVSEVVGPFLFSAEGKFGAMASFARMDITDVFVNDDTTSATFPSNTTVLSAKDTEFATVSSLQLAVRYHMFQNVAAILGYEMMYGSRFALAPEQLTTNLTQDASGMLSGTTGDAKVEQDGDLFLYGFSLGFEIFW